VRIEFRFSGLIPNGVYTLWNVLETDPFKDEPLGPFGSGKHSLVADDSGHAQKVVVIDKWPSKEFLLDYHADGNLTAYPGRTESGFPRDHKGASLMH